MHSLVAAQPDLAVRLARQQLRRDQAAMGERRQFDLIGRDDLGQSRVNLVIRARGIGRRGPRVVPRGESAGCGHPFGRVDADVEKQGCFGRVCVARAPDLSAGAVLWCLPR